jgi:hypothetical protein
MHEIRDALGNRAKLLLGTAALIRGLRKPQSRKPIEIQGTAATMIVPITSASI